MTHASENDFISDTKCEKESYFLAYSIINDFVRRMLYDYRCSCGANSPLGTLRFNHRKTKNNQVQII